MARNKHPEETVNLILDVSYRLFMEKGYEHTSIQDIINHFYNPLLPLRYFHQRGRQIKNF